MRAKCKSSKYDLYFGGSEVLLHGGSRVDTGATVVTRKQTTWRDPTLTHTAGRYRLSPRPVQCVKLPIMPGPELHIKNATFSKKHIMHDYIWFFYLYTCKEEIKKEKKKHISIKYIDVHFFSPSETNLKFYMLHQQCLPQLKASTEKKNWHELVRFIYESILSCRLTDLNCTSSCRL